MTAPSADADTAPKDSPPSRHTVLIIEDNVVLRMALRDGLELSGIRTVVAPDLATAWTQFLSNDIDVVLLDEQLPDGRGHTLCPRLLDERPWTKVIFMTGFPEIEHAVRAIRAGAFDYLLKPFEMEALSVALDRCFRVLALERIGRREEARQEQESSDVQLIGTSPAFREVRAMVDRASESSAPVLITGDTGTGKSLIARAIHTLSERRKAPFLALSCAALPDNLVEAELFGWERGSFTGAVATRDGAFVMADRGTLFLDEIGEMPLHLQPKLLTALEERTVRRLGGRAAQPVEARIVAATNADLERCIQNKTFRADLFYRLNVIHIHVPALRERPEDIPQLALHILKKVVGRRETPTLSDGELVWLSEYDWPGNVRELRNVLERAVLLQGSRLRPSELLGRRSAKAHTSDLPEGPTERFLSLDEVESRHMDRALEVSKGNLTQAARLLGISLSTLKRRRNGESQLDRLKLTSASSS